MNCLIQSKKNWKTNYIPWSKFSVLSKRVKWLLKVSDMKNFYVTDINLQLVCLQHFPQAV